MLKDSVRKILGRTIAAVVFKEKSSPGDPSWQLFLVFDDDKSFEFYGTEDELRCSSHLETGGRKAVHEYMQDSMKTSLEAYIRCGFRCVKRY